MKEREKTTSLQSIENVNYEKQKLNTRFYLAQVYQSFQGHLTNTFPFLTSHFLLFEYTWSPQQAQFQPFLETT